MNPHWASIITAQGILADLVSLPPSQEIVVQIQHCCNNLLYHARMYTESCGSGRPLTPPPQMYNSNFTPNWKLGTMDGISPSTYSSGQSVMANVSPPTTHIGDHPQNTIVPPNPISFSNWSPSDIGGKKEVEIPKRCSICSEEQTPEWRKGPDGRKTLCNACGLSYWKKEKLERKKLEQEGLSFVNIERSLVSLSEHIVSQVYLERISNRKGRKQQ